MTVSTEKALHEILPREQVGARTGELYEYQYHQAAIETLSLLNDANAICVYCEWHDDYVVESGDTGHYAFHQVKTRKQTEGLWTWPNFFGLGKQKKDGSRSLNGKSSSIFSRLWDHTTKFGTRCARFVFVSDSELDPEFSKLLEETRGVENPEQMAEPTASIFKSIYGAISAKSSEIPNPTETNLFNFLRRLHFAQAFGSVGNLEDIKVLLAGRIHEASEVDIRLSEAKRIGEDLVSTVKKRSHLVLPGVPASVAELRAAKGIVIDDLLRVLSLSKPGFLLLKEGKQEAVRTLSRLQRICVRNKEAQTLIPDLCELKMKWLSWWTAQRTLVDGSDLISLKSQCANVLTVHSSGIMNFKAMADEAKSLAGEYSSLKTTEQISADHVMGLIITLAVEAEAL